ncbi:MAG: hypothetical protein U1E19_12730 [Rhodoblastus sp.]
MFFNVDSDRGAVISGWFAADNPAQSARLAIRTPGRPDVLVDADQQRDDVRELGIHGTGKVGFRIDKSIVPDLDELVDVEIVEAETRLPIYRRLQPGRHVEKKLILFDAALMPQRRVLDQIRDSFALTYFSLERFSLETSIVVLTNLHATSLVVTGRPNCNRYRTYLDNSGYIKAALLREPYEELAERLLFLNLLARSPSAHLASTFLTGVAPLLDFARDLPLSDSKALVTQFRQLGDEQKKAMASPMVRMLGCDIGDEPERRHVSTALDNLASMDVVGCRERYGAFRNLLWQTLGEDVLGDDMPAAFASVTSLADSLRRVGVIGDLLEQDVELYRLAREAIDAGLSGQSELILRDTQAT